MREAVGGHVMKILAWMLFITLTTAFVVVFCKQQIEVHAEAQLAEMELPTAQWVRVSKMDFGDPVDPATTQPWQFTEATPSDSAVAAPTVAAGDMGDALK